MPEGHVIHRLAAEIEERFVRRIVRATSPQGRFTEGARAIDGHKVLGAEAIGKHLFVRVGGGLMLHVHLGLYGRFTFGDAPVPDPVGQIRLRLVNRTSFADLRGATRCELLVPSEVEAIAARLGDDPLDARATGERAFQRITKSTRSIAALLMDQTVVAGSGNIYRAEVLFRAGIDPFRSGRQITPGEWQGMWQEFVELMQQGFELGRIDTVRPEHTPEAMGRPPREDDHGGEVYVYRRAGQACHICGDTVRQVELAGRNLFWCATCQSASTS